MKTSRKQKRTSCIEKTKALPKDFIYRLKCDIFIHHNIYKNTKQKTVYMMGIQVSVIQLLDTGHAFKLFNQQNRKQMWRVTHK